MSEILIVLGSARIGRVAEKVAEYVKADLATREGVSVKIADLKEIALPFFDNEISPASPDYVITNQNVITWSEMVTAADGIVFITPEYNHTLSAIQKNAIDSLATEWVEKPVTAVAYGWTGGSLAVATLREVMTHLKSDLKPTITQLGFMKDLNPDGSLLDEVSVSAQIKTTLDEIL